jgi:chemotaxis protein MotB
MFRSPLALSLLLLAGCVTQGKYDDLKQQYDAARAELSERKQAIAGLERNVASEQANVQALRADAARLGQQLEQLERQRADAAAELARLNDEQARLTEELASVIKDRSRLKESTDQLGRALLELGRRNAEADKRIAEYRNLLARFKDLIDAGTLKIVMADGRMVLQLPSDVLFDSGSARLSKSGKDAVTQVALVLRDMNERRFQVEGHTDNVPIRTAQYPSNWELAAGRAFSVIRAMHESGMDGSLISAASFGEYRPTATNDTHEGRAANRRIEIVLVPDLSMLPGYDELQRIVEGA